MRYQNPHFGQAMQGLGSALFGNPQAEGQAMLAKAQMDRQNQETVAREQLGDQIMNAVRRGTDPRQTQANIYGQSVRIGDNMAAIAPEFGRGAGMGIYGTEGMGVRGAADLHMGAGGAFQETEMGMRQALEAEAAQAAAERQAAMEQARFEAAQPRVMEEGELMVGPDGQVMLHAAPSEVLGPDERQTQLGPDGSLGVGVGAAEGVIDAQNRLTLGEAALAEGEGALATSEAERIGADIYAGRPGAEVGRIRSETDANRGEAESARADARETRARVDAGGPTADVAETLAAAGLGRSEAEVNRAEADRTVLGNQFFEANPGAMGDALFGTPDGVGAGDTGVVTDAMNWGMIGQHANALLDNAVRAGDLREFNEQDAGVQSAIRQRTAEIVADPRGVSDTGAALQTAIQSLIQDGVIGTDSRGTLRVRRPDALGMGGGDSNEDPLNIRR